MFSVIIPTLNEAENLPRCIGRIRDQLPDVEIIVVDGGSNDDTVSIAESENVTVCRSRPGRGTQCNVGASHASGEILLFLHGDTLLPIDAFEILDGYFKNPQVQVGLFRLGFDCPHWIMRGYAQFTRFDSLFTRFGDQCIVVRAIFFYQCGGFPDWPLFEDVQFLQQVRRKTRIYCFPAAVITSARRYVRNGMIRQQVLSAWLLFLFLVGISPERLAKKYGSKVRGSPTRMMVILSLIFALSGCVQPESDPVNANGNRNPVIESLVADPTTFNVGASATVTVIATDPDNNPLTYQWRASTGDIIGEGPAVLYSASFCCAGPNLIWVTVKDNAGGSVSQSVDIFINYP